MASTVAILPLVIAFVLLQRYIVEGVERTGING
jgi:ABC-type glycerol-3-phosphate transport system permease component